MVKENKEFGYRLASLRAEKGLSGKQLADILGVPKSAVCHWEAGDNYPNNDRIIALADLFDVTTDYLLGRTDNKKSIKVLTSEGNEEDLNLNSLTTEQQELIKNMIRQFNNIEQKK